MKCLYSARSQSWEVSRLLVVLPKFVYRVALICCDKKKNVMKEINSVIYNFVWVGKDKVEKQALIGEFTSMLWCLSKWPNSCFKEQETTFFMHLFWNDKDIQIGGKLIYNNVKYPINCDDATIDCKKIKLLPRRVTTDTYS